MQLFLDRSLDGKLRCTPRDLGSNHQLLAKRMAQSQSLLSQAIDAVEEWSASMSARWHNAASFSDHFLRETSYGQTHTRRDHAHIDSKFILFHAIEEACLQHAKANTAWWRVHERRLRQSHEAALIYIVIRAYTENASSNVASIESVLTDKEVLEYHWTFEVGQLIRASFHLLDPTAQDKVIKLILDLHGENETQDDHQRAWITQKQRDCLQMVPSFCLTPSADERLRSGLLRYGPANNSPHIETRGGLVVPPFSDETLLGLTDEAILRVVRHYEIGGRGDLEHDFLVGGRDQVTQVVYDAASKQPLRFMAMLGARWLDLPPRYRDAIFSGVAIHLVPVQK